MAVKCAFLYSYYSLLDYLGLGIGFKFWSFIILTPIVKYYYYQNTKVFITSVIIDFIFGILYYQYVIYWDGLWIFLYVLIIPVWVLTNEYLQYLFLGGKDETFVIKFSPNPTDYLLVIIFSLVYIFVGLTLPPNIPITARNFGFWIAMLIMFDFIFGILHYWSHTIPWIRKYHLLHHEYRKEDLNTIANYYADLIDSFLMNVPNIFLGLAHVWFVQNPVGIKEFFNTAVYTHHKYPTNQLTLIYYFEFELIDMVLGGVRMANYHNAHHKLVDQNFSGWGIFNDKMIIDCTKTLSSALGMFFPQLLK
jgi:hypothetical protein